jgi:hypothetical protein
MKTTLLLIALQLASNGSDAYFTGRSLSSGGYYERDPIAKPFVTTTRGRVSYFSATASLSIAVPWYMRRHGKRRLAELGSLATIADSTTGAWQSAHHTR